MHSETVQRTGSAARGAATGRASCSITISWPFADTVEQRCEVARGFRVRDVDHFLGHDQILRALFLVQLSMTQVDSHQREYKQYRCDGRFNFLQYFSFCVTKMPFFDEVGGRGVFGWQARATIDSPPLPSSADRFA